jgi:Phosphate-starvation-inducible E.
LTRSLRDLIKESLIAETIGLILEILFLFGAVYFVIFTAYQLVFDVLESNPSGALKDLILNGLNVIIFLELREFILAYMSGKGKSVVYVIDATTAFVLREIIVAILSGAISDLTLLSLTLTALGGIRFLISKAMTY